MILHRSVRNPLLTLLLLATAALSAQAAPHVKRAVFTSGIENREPVDRLLSLSNNVTEVIFFTELRDLQGHRVVHRWTHGDRTMAEVGFDVGGPRWRVWSSKRLDPAWVGEWRVQVVDQDGTVLAEERLQYGSGG